MKELTHEDYLRNLKAYMKHYMESDEEINNSLDDAKKSYSEEDDSCEIFNKHLFDDVERATLPTDYKSVDRMVSHPSHYQSKNGIEVIDVIEAFTEDLEGIEAICTGNAIKYLCRWSKKNGVQDLEKAIWYLQHLINVLKSKNKE